MTLSAELAALREQCPEGDYQLRPDKYDDWGFVRADNHLLVGMFSTAMLAWRDEDKPPFGSPEWHDGPPMVKAVAEMFCFAANNASAIARECEELRAENERLRAENERLREALQYADRFGSRGDIEFSDNSDHVGKSVSYFIDKALNQ